MNLIVVVLDIHRLDLVFIWVTDRIRSGAAIHGEMWAQSLHLTGPGRENVIHSPSCFLESKFRNVCQINLTDPES